MQTQRGLPQHLVDLATPGQKKNGIDEPPKVASHYNQFGNWVIFFEHQLTHGPLVIHVWTPEMMARPLFYSQWLAVQSSWMFLALRQSQISSISATPRSPWSAPDSVPNCLDEVYLCSKPFPYMFKRIQNKCPNNSPTFQMFHLLDGWATTLDHHQQSVIFSFDSGW